MPRPSFPLSAVLLGAVVGCGALRSNEPAPLVGNTDVQSRAVRTIGDAQIAFSLRFVGAVDGAPMMTMYLRNAGTDGIAIDVTRLRVTAFAGDRARRLELVDPRGELEKLTLEPGARAVEKIRLADPARTDDDVTAICIDPTAMVSAQVPPVCFVPSADSEWSVR